MFFGCCILNRRCCHRLRKDGDCDRDLLSSSPPLSSPKLTKQEERRRTHLEGNPLRPYSWVSDTCGDTPRGIVRASSRLIPSFGLAIKVTAAHTGHTLLYTLWFTDHTVSSSTSSTRASAPLCAPAGHVRARRTFLSVAERAITLKLCLKARVLNPSPFNTPLSHRLR